MNKAQREVAEYLLDKEERIIKQLERQFAQALEDVEMDIRIMLMDEQTPSRIHRVEYQKRLKAQIESTLENLHRNEYKTINQFLQDSYTDAFVGTMYDLHSQGVPIIAPIDQNAAVKAIQLDTQLSDRKIHPNANGEHVTLYESLGVDVDNLKEVIRQEITRGLATNMLPENIARNIANLTKAPLSRAKTIARTEAHRIQEASAQDARERAISRGARVVKQWDATMDGATREAHRRLDGQIVEVKEPFTYGTLTAMYPGDFGDPAQDCNCRCKAVQRAKWMLDEEELEEQKRRAEFFGLGEHDAKEQQFTEFEKKYLKATEEQPQIETRQQAITAIEDCGFRLTGHGMEYMPDDQVIVAAQRLQELEQRFGCAKDGNYTLEASVFSGANKKAYACVRTTKTAGNNLALNANYYSKNVQALEKSTAREVARGWSMPCAEEHMKHYVITHEYGHMVEAMAFKKRNGVSLSELDATERKALFQPFGKSVWGEIAAIAKENNPDFKVTKTVISEYGRTDHAEAFAETFANAYCGKPNELGRALIVWLERNGI